MNYWGHHLILDCYQGKTEFVTDPERIRQFSKSLVEKIDMKAWGEPQVVHFAEHCPDKAGWTLVQLIETSNICAHFIDSSGDFYLDVFSCKDFDTETVVNEVRGFFEPVNIKTQRFIRSADAK